MQRDSIGTEFLRALQNYWDYTWYLLKNPGWENPFYWIIGMWFFTFCLELIFPKKLFYPVIGRKGFFTDFLYILVNDIFINALGLYALTVVFESAFLALLHSGGTDDIRLINISTWPLLLQLGLIFIIQDFLEFTGHYLLHRLGFLWQFHKIHHAQTQLGAGSARHFHFAEYLIFRPLLYIPFHMIGFNLTAYVFVQLTVHNFFSYFTHCNIKTRWGAWNYWINNPETHYWHHARNIPRRYGVNYASILNIWDVLFKTYYVPEGKTPILGTEDDKKVPVSFAGQLLFPFRHMFTLKTPDQNPLRENQKVKSKPK